MAQNPRPINMLNPIVEADGTPAQAFRVWLIGVTNGLTIVGTGNPEGVLEAPQYSLYVDETVPLVPVQYRKMLPEVGGDRTMGWAAL